MTSTSCDLYPVLPASFDNDDMLATLPIILAHPEVTALRIPGDHRLNETELNTLLKFLHESEVALIVDVGTDLSTAVPELLGESDGLHAPDPLQLTALRKQLEGDIQIGCRCQTRDDAMKAGETGADYVAFTPTELDILRWWVSVMELPAVAEEITTPEAAVSARKAGADFLAIPLLLDDSDEARFTAILGALAA
ncbi:thiamine phosphate synthase [Gluconobacter morbifer]|uniref:Thiamine phosphate synthase/TenI domain-containing protein n=1 Tax=Gluconobacter morbifer G707 TaxID=1088869 RepID=G6XKN8_9PROT|nr:thiamine phosphate synthase [Gluconobacter morbifer]EHH67601.1 hypothetical protein GMO_20540 [Gluconobacter morbifer G707]